MIDATEINRETAIHFGANFFGITYEQVTSKSRKEEHVESRYYIMKYLYDNTKLTLKEIAEPFNRHYSTVIHAKKTLSEHIYTEELTRDRYNKFSNNFKTII